jgi:cyclopropane fatty-acyl-phospholipid synthase-like methyltransferase
VSDRPGLVARWYPRLYEWYFTRTPIGRKLREVENAVQHAALDRLLEPGDEILDVGCGTGQYTLPIARTARRVVGIDPAQPMLDHLEARAREEGIANVETRHGPAPDAIPAGERFDGVVMIGVFNYIERFEDVVRAVGGVMKPGAWWLFTVVPPSLEGKVHRATDRVVGSRVHLRSVEEVTRACARAGLEVEHLGTQGLTKGGIDATFVARRPQDSVR